MVKGYVLASMSGYIEDERRAISSTLCSVSDCDALYSTHYSLISDCNRVRFYRRLDTSDVCRSLGGGMGESSVEKEISS